MYSTHIAELDLPSLPPATRRVHIVPALNATSLLLMGQLCDAGCVVTFDAKTVTVKLNDERILDGVRTPTTGLWQLSMVKPTLSPPLPLLLHHHSFAAVQSATPAELVTFAHASLFSPALSTLDAALARGFLPTFLGLTTKTLRRHPPTSIAMIKGHLDQSGKKQRSTKKIMIISPDESASNDQQATDSFPDSDLGNARSHH